MQVCNVAMGSPNVVMGSPNVVMGSPNVVMGSPNVVMGSPNVVMGSPNVVMGSPNVVMGSPNVVMGSPNVVMGSPNVVMGSPNVVMSIDNGALHAYNEAFLGECAAPAPTKYKVTLDANSGTFGTSSTALVEVETGKTIPTSTTLPTRANYTLESWNTAKDGKGTSFVFGETPVTADVTIYAQWSVVKHTVTLNANGGIDGKTKTITVAYGGVVPTSTTDLPTRIDYNLTGWNTKADKTGTVFVFGTTPVTANIEIFAQWSAITPDAPTGLTAFASADTVALSWNVAAGAGYYDVYRNDIKINTEKITSTNFVDRAVDEDTLYKYSIQACNSLGCVSMSATAAANITTKSLTVTVTEIARIGTDKRFHYVAFSIETNLPTPNYTFGLVLKTDAAPTAAALRSGASFVRSLNSTKKNMLIAYPITSDIRKNYATASQSKVKGSTADALLLKPNTTYSLYGVKNASTTVKNIAVLSTDAFPSGGLNAVTFSETSTQAVALSGLDYLEKSIAEPSGIIFSHKISENPAFHPLFAGFNASSTGQVPIGSLTFYLAATIALHEPDGVLTPQGNIFNVVLPSQNYVEPNEVSTKIRAPYLLRYPSEVTNTKNDRNKVLFVGSVYNPIPTGFKTITMNYYTDEE
ncbi:hypothetical protein CHS0354_023911 [Potamilus streckersoni]|uniref:Fibronectin type-III domain-containing protein n=1 Tax=Potamilus streckersoni TaxID=2493646 RepID=A0AAE0RZ27_9BIVA|nr:hypothetical protein CHS0354_023911 [Potamilus streckersoni]